MPFSEFQKAVLAFLAKNRSPESHFAGGIIANAADSSPRHSRDFNIFHDVAGEAVRASEADVESLRRAQFDIEPAPRFDEWTRDATFRTARVASESGEVLAIDWAADSAFRFFPIVRIPAIRRLDPLSPFVNAWSVLFWRMLNEPDSAIAQYGHAQEVNPGYVYLEPWVDDVYRARKQYPAALRVGMEASKALGRPTSGLIVTLAAMGRRDEAILRTNALEAYVSKGAYVPPEVLVRAWMAIGDRERAIRYLEHGVEARSGLALVAMIWFPELQPLSDDPRVRQIHAKFVLH